MEDNCGKRFSSVTAHVNDETDRKLLREDTKVTETVNKDDLISQFGPEKLEKSYCSSNSTSDLSVPETRGYAMIPESKGNAHSYDIRNTSETKEIGSLDVVATRCDEILEQTSLANSSDKWPVEDVSMTSIETSSHEADKIKDSVLKKSVKRKNDGNNVIEYQYNKTIKTTAVGGSKVKITYPNVTKTSGIMNFNSTDRTFTNSCKNISINSFSTCRKYFNCCKNVYVNSSSIDDVFINCCKNVFINPGSVGRISINASKNVSINSGSVGPISINTCKNVSINSGSVGPIFINTCKNVSINSKKY